MTHDPLARFRELVKKEDDRIKAYQADFTRRTGLPIKFEIAKAILRKIDGGDNEDRNLLECNRYEERMRKQIKKGGH